MISESNSQNIQYQNAIDAHTKHSADLLGFANVIGTGVGFTKTAGIQTSQHCVKVFVQKKLPKDSLPLSAILPEFIYQKDNAPIRVDVEEMEIPTVPLPVKLPSDADVSMNSQTNLSQRYRPAAGGVSAASYRFPVGTLSVAVKDASYPYYDCILSNNHVFAYLNKGVIGDPILQPAYGAGGVIAQDEIGALARFVPLTFGQGGSNRVDAAIAYVYPGSALQEITFIGDVNTVTSIADIAVGEQVQKVGCVSGLTSGTIQATHANLWINYEIAGYGYTPTFFTDQIITGHMAMYGDSGSVLLDQSKNILGLLGAGSTTHTVFNYMANVETDLGIYFAQPVAATGTNETQATERKIPIKGSNRFEIAAAKIVGKPDYSKRIKISIYARSNPNPSPEILDKIEKLKTELPANRTYLTNDEFSNVYGSDPMELDKIEQWCTQNHLLTIEKNATKKRLVVEGTIEDVGKAFGVEFNEYELPSADRYRGRAGQVYIPEDLSGIIEGVFGLDTRSIGHSKRQRSRFAPVKWDESINSARNKKIASAMLTPWAGTFFPPQVAKLYKFPENFDGTGQNVAIFAFNGDGPDKHGGYSLSALTTYFEKVLGQKVPSITDVVVQGAGNNPGADSNASSQNGDSTGEVMLDICVVGSVAPGAKIYVYFTEFDSKGWVDALYDAIAGDNDIAVISISYGNPEKDPQSAWTPMGVNVVNQALEASIAKGITICCSSGDDGSSNDNPYQAEVDFPASSPNVLAVGGTKLIAGGNPQSIISETVWNEIFQQAGATGGGVSEIFSKPAYQDSVNVPASVNPPHKIGRGVPDVAGIADPVTGVVIQHVDGLHLEPIGGTSVSAPLWSALVARLNQGLSAKCGFINELLYTKCATGVLRDITTGNNGSYYAQQGWDACTGLGSPNGGQLLQALKPEAVTSSGDNY